MKCNRFTITGILFLITIFGISLKTFIQNNNQIIKAMSNNTLLDTVEEKYTNDIAFSDEFIYVWSKLQPKNDFAKIKLYDDAEYGVLMQDENDYLYFPAPYVDISEYAEKTVAFSKKLKDMNIPYVYIQVPNKIIEGYSNPELCKYNFSNENADEFLQILNDNNVDYLDLREEIEKDNLDVYELFYKSDHHWNTKAAFWCFQRIVSLLKQEYYFFIDDDNFYTNINNYNQTLKKQSFLGSLGRRVGEAISGLDDYNFIEPNFDTQYSLYNGVVSLNNPIKRGNFYSAIAIDKIINSRDVKANKHGSYFEWDYGFLRINNEMINNNYKILIIKDSFMLPVVAYLSTCVSQIDMVDLRDTPKANLGSILEDNNYDLVIQAYNTEAFNETMFSY